MVMHPGQAGKAANCSRSAAEAKRQDRNSGPRCRAPTVWMMGVRWPCLMRVSIKSWHCMGSSARPSLNTYLQPGQQAGGCSGNSQSGGQRMLQAWVVMSTPA